MTNFSVTKLAFAFSIAFALAGCETTQGPISSGAACEIFKPISYSRYDSKPTISEVRQHNAAGRAACKW